MGVLQVLKRDGTVVPFSKDKIIQAISKAGFVEEYIKNKIACEIKLHTQFFNYFQFIFLV